MSEQMTDGQYVIESTLPDKKVLEVKGEKANDGTEVDLWQNNDKPYQHWQLTKVDESKGEVFYTIGHPNSPMVMEAPGPDWKPGDPIVLRDYVHDGGDKSHRQWKLVPTSSQTNVCQIVNRRSGLVVDVKNGDSGQGQVKQYESWPGAPDNRQKWKLTRVATTGTGTTRGLLYSWGYNGEGQLGDGGYTQQSAPEKQPYLTSGIKAISAGGRHSLALLEDGTVEGWGWNQLGQLGDGGTTNRNVPKKVSDLKDVKSISAGEAHSLALLKGGIVRAWGWDNEGQLGDGAVPRSPQQSPATVDLKPAKAVAAGGGHSLALLEDGTVWAWGSGDYGQLGNAADRTDSHSPVQVLFERDGVEVITIAAGGYHSLALLKDRTVWAWGANNWGQIGDDTILDRLRPVQVKGLEGVTAVAAGSHHSLALLKDRTVQAWGYNGTGGLGDGTTTAHHRPVPVKGLEGVEAITAGPFRNWSHFSLARLADGTVRAWGWNYVSQLGDGSSTDRHEPVPVPGLKGVKSINAGGFHGLALVDPRT